MYSIKNIAKITGYNEDFIVLDHMETLLITADVALKELKNDFTLLDNKGLKLLINRVPDTCGSINTIKTL